jgi:hypothetical protein
MREGGGVAGRVLRDLGEQRRVELVDRLTAPRPPSHCRSTYRPH